MRSLYSMCSGPPPRESSSDIWREWGPEIPENLFINILSGSSERAHFLLVAQLVLEPVRRTRGSTRQSFGNWTPVGFVAFCLDFLSPLFDRRGSTKSANMFWGLIMEPNKRYTQIVEKDFHLSMASLDAQASGDEVVQVMMCYEGRTYLLCTLQNGSIFQVPLDLNFQEGTKISFTCNGKGFVHLTGYLVPDDGGYDDLDELGEEDEEEDEEDEGIPDLVDMKKRKKGPQNKKELPLSKKSKPESESEDGSDSDSDDEDESLGLGNESDEDDDSDDDEESDEDDEQDEEEDEKPVKKQKQNQQVQQNNKKNQEKMQNQHQPKKEKEKLTNGKEIKTEKEQTQKKKKDESKNFEKAEQQQPKKRILEGGLQIEDIREGNGPVAKSGKFVTVYYVGKLKNGKKFDQTTQGEGFKFRLGRSEVIKGWDVGIVGMKVGGKRRITIPPQMGYGAKGSPPVIPPNSQLNFEVELRGIN